MPTRRRIAAAQVLVVILGCGCGGGSERPTISQQPRAAPPATTLIGPAAPCPEVREASEAELAMVSGRTLSIVDEGIRTISQAREVAREQRDVTTAACLDEELAWLRSLRVATTTAATQHEESEGPEVGELVADARARCEEVRTSIRDAATCPSARATPRATLPQDPPAPVERDTAIVGVRVEGSHGYEIRLDGRVPPPPRAWPLAITTSEGEHQVAVAIETQRLNADGDPEPHVQHHEIAIAARSLCVSDVRARVVGPPTESGQEIEVRWRMDCPETERPPFACPSSLTPSAVSEAVDAAVDVLAADAMRAVASRDPAAIRRAQVSLGRAYAIQRELAGSPSMRTGVTTLCLEAARLAAASGA